MRMTHGTAMLLGGLTSGGPYPLGAMNRTGCPQNSTCSTGPVMFENDMVVWEIIRWKIAPAACLKSRVLVPLETRNPTYGPKVDSANALSRKQEVDDTAYWDRIQ